MALGYGDTSFMPYGDDELNTLQGLLGTPDASSVPAAPYPAPQAPQVEPMAPAPAMAEPVAAPEPAPAVAPVVQPYHPPAPAQPLDLGFQTPSEPPKGLVRSGFTSEGVAAPERDKLAALHQQLADQQMASIDSGAKATADVAQSGIARADKRIGAANVEANKAQMALAGQQSARQKLEAEGAEWSKLKEDPSKAFEGIEWAGVLAAIGIGAGTFAQAMGWQRDNPVLDQFNKAVDRSVAAQRERKNSRLQEIRARIGDSTAAENILSAQLHDAIADRAEAEMQRASNEDALKRLGSIVESERAKVQENVLAAYERMVPREQEQYSAPKPAGAGKTQVDAWKEALEFDKIAEERGMPPDHPIRQAIRKSLGDGFSQTKPEQDRAEEARKAKVSEEQYSYEEAKSKAAKDAIGSLAGKLKLTRGPDGKWTAGKGLVSEGTGELLKEGLKEGATAGLYTSPLRADFDAAAEAYGRAQSGGQIGKEEAIGDEQRAGFIRQLGGNALGAQEVADRLNAAENALEARLPRKYRKEATGGDRAPTREEAGFRKQGQQ